MDICRRGILLKVLAALGAGYRDEVFSLGEYPRQCQLAGRHPFAFGDGADTLNQDLVLVEVLTGKARVTFGAEICVAEILSAGDGAGKESTAERAIRNEADTKFSDSRNDLLFGVPLPKRVFGLKRCDGMDLVCA